MTRRRAKRICRILCAVSVLLMALSAMAAFGCAVCVAHGNMSAVLPLAISIAVFWVASEMADATDRRTNG